MSGSETGSNGGTTQANLVREIDVGEVSDGPLAKGEPGSRVTLPVQDILTGRGFITGKSGSGKSNTVSVVVERLLDASYPCLIIDTDGEYWGLKEEFEVLHAGGDEECDIQVAPEHAEKLATLALEDGIPIILDVSTYLDEDVADELVKRVARRLFVKEKKLKQPFLLVVEECHEYIPQQGSAGGAGQMLIKVGKRGRKHGLGIVGISQRPANVKKDFITQANWLCWHRLTWDNDTTVVSSVLGSDYADAVEDLSDGEAFLMCDWRADIERIQFDRKETFDAGATPGLDDFERPDLKSVSGDLLDDLEDISEQHETYQTELEETKAELERVREEKEQLQEELDQMEMMQDTFDRMADALAGRAGADDSGDEGESTTDLIRAEVLEIEEQKEELADELAEARETIAEQDERIDELERELAEASVDEDLEELRQDLATVVGEHADTLEVDIEAPAPEPPAADNSHPHEDDLVALMRDDGIQSLIDDLGADSSYSVDHTRDVLVALAHASDALTTGEVAPHTEVATSTVSKILNELDNQNVVTKHSSGQGVEWSLNVDLLADVATTRSVIDRISTE